MPSTTTDPSFVRARERGAAISYYISRHDVKVQGDYFQIAEPGTGRRSHQARTQFQVYF